MYSAVLATHSLLRWLVLIVGVIAVARALSGWAGRKPWRAADNRAGLWFTIALDVQLVLGLLLYLVLSPTTRLAAQNMAAAMRDPAIRYWVVEHPTGMVLAIILAHVGRVLVRKSRDDAARHRRAAVWMGLALLVILASIPWPWMANGRPLWPF